MDTEKARLELAQALKQYLCVPQAAVAVRLLDSVELESAPPWLEGFRRPGAGLPAKTLTCQAMAMVRLYGWRVMLTPQAVDCPTGLLTMGWVSMSPAYLAGEVPVTPYNQTPQARAARMKVLPCLEAGSVAALAAAPLDNCPFEPQVVVVYCNPAQAMRMVQATLFAEGGSVESASSGAQGCSQYITRVLQTGQPRYVIPGNGDRIFGHVEEHQMAFSLPVSRMAELAQGIRLSHEGGQIYPVQAFLRAEFRVPKAYMQASDHLRAHTQGSQT